MSKQKIERMFKGLGQGLQREKLQVLKQLTINEIAVVKRQGSYYLVLIDLGERVSVRIIKTRKFSEIKKSLEAWDKKILTKI